MTAKRTMRSAAAICGAIAITGSGCAQRISYSTRHVETVHHPRFAGQSLLVEELRDRRETPYEPEPRMVVRQVFAEIDGVQYHVNHNFRYANNQVGPGVTRMLARHLEKTGMFAPVSHDRQRLADSDYLLEGEIASFEGRMQRSVGGDILAGFSPVAGGLAGPRRHYVGTTSLDLRLSERASGQLVWAGTAEGRVEGASPSRDAQKAAYNVANISLKEAVSSLIQKLQEVE